MSIGSAVTDKSSLMFFLFHTVLEMECLNVPFHIVFRFHSLFVMETIFNARRTR